MALLGNLIKRGIKLRESLNQDFSSPFDLQKAELRELIIAARNTQFGRAYNFDEILDAFKRGGHQEFYEVFKKNVPVFNYDKMHDAWWHKLVEGEKDVSWPVK